MTENMPVFAPRMRQIHKKQQMPSRKYKELREGVVVFNLIYSASRLHSRSVYAVGSSISKPAISMAWL